MAKYSVNLVPFRFRKLEYFLPYIKYAFMLILLSNVHVLNGMYVESK